MKVREAYYAIGWGIVLGLCAAWLIYWVTTLALAWLDGTGAT
jgi:hypothetical protein